MAVTGRAGPVSWKLANPVPTISPLALLTTWLWGPAGTLSHQSQLTDDKTEAQKSCVSTRNQCDHFPAALSGFSGTGSGPGRTWVGGGLGRAGGGVLVGGSQ